MAIYHLSIKIISRGKGRSVVAAAAYRAGEQITNEYDGLTHDYTRKGGVVHTEILLPGHVPKEYADRAVLWNAVEKSERHKTAQLAREVELALPVELSREQSISLVREYVNRHFVAAGMCADICVHDKNDGNPHAHILLTMRPIGHGGVWGMKSRTVNGKKIPAVDWNELTKAEKWRAAWADICNRALEQNGHAERIDHRSYKRQGVEQIPTVHLGVAAAQMERKGIATRRGNRNRVVAVTNSQLRQLRARIVKLQNWMKEVAANATTSPLADVVQGILSRQEQQPRRYRQALSPKNAAKVINFLTSNSVTDMAGLEKKVKSMYAEQHAIREELRPVERRMAVLDEHIRQAEIYLQHKPVYAQYQQEHKPKKKETFYEAHRAELAPYEAARDYLKGVMNGKTGLPVKEWAAERAGLATDRSRLYSKYVSLKDEVKEVELIKWTVYNLMREENHRAQPPKMRGGMER